MRFVLPKTAAVFALAAAAWWGADAAAQPSPPQGRLPKYFNRVIDGIQREKIYKIQGDFEKQIDELQAKIDDLKKQRDAEVFKLLTPEQQERIKDLAKEALEAEKRQVGVPGAPPTAPAPPAPAPAAPVPPEETK